MRNVREWRVGSRLYRQFRKQVNGEIITVNLPADVPMDHPRFLAEYAKAAAGFMGKPVETVKDGTVDQVGIAYLESAAFRELAPVTQKNRAAAIKRFRKMFGDLMVKSLEPRDVERYLAQKSPAAAKSDMKALRPMFRHGKRLGLCDDLSAGVELERVKVKGFRTWTAEDLEAFMARWPVGTTERLAFDIARWTGAARVDLAGLGWHNVRDGLLSYRRSKTGREAHVPLSPRLQAVIAPLKGQMVFLLTSFGKPFTANGLGNMMGAAAREAGITAGSTFHGLRKAFVCHYLEAGKTPTEVAVMIGDNVAEVDRYGREMDRKRIAKAMTGG